MKNSVRRLTQAELANELQGRGFEITQRTIAEWRKNHLLPPFDVIGSGLGQGQGRERGSWSRRESVINQALWVCQLRPRYKCYEDLYIPLWMLGYPIPLEIVRHVLTYPLKSEMEAIRSEAAAFIRKFELNPARKGVVEDMIDDAVNSSDSYAEAIPEELKMPQEGIEGLLNLFLNPDCDLEDPVGVFKNSREAVKRWDSETKKLELEILESEGIEPVNQGHQDTTFSNIFKHARFIQQNFSLHQLEKAVTECTDGDLKQIQIDMNALCEIGLLCNKLFYILTKDVRAELQTREEDVFTILLRMSKWIIWADLSVRRNGHGQVMDVIREYARNEVKEKLTETLEQQVEAMAPVVAEGMEKAADIMERFFVTRIGKTGIQCAP
jgi:hypothetical protein